MAALPDLESLQLLVLVGEHGSLTSAAAVAGISQPSASKRMSAFERRLGLTLLDRSRRGSVLTPSGVVVCGWAQRVLDQVTVLLDGVVALRREHAPQLSLAASLTVAEHLLPIWLGDLRRIAPELHVGLQVVNSSRVCELALQGAVDVGFVESPGGLRGLQSRVVARDRLVLVVAPEHPWSRRRRPLRAGELAATPLVSREPGSGTRETVDRAIVAAGFRPAPPLLELGSGAAVRNAVAAGAGAALLSDLVVAPDLAAGVLAEVPTADIDLGRTLRAVWRAGARPTGRAADLLLVAERRRRSSGARERRG